MHRIGLKLWSTNESFIDVAQDLYMKGIYDFLEIYVVPGSRTTPWENIHCPVSLHAPHSYSGLNLSIPYLKGDNCRMIICVENFRLKLNPQYIIFHPGINGSVGETIRQILFFKNEFGDLFKSALIENKPKVGLKNETCIGASPMEIERIITETGLGFCFDIGHAICYAARIKLPEQPIIDEFIYLGPQVFHISDGFMGSEKDKHLNLGMGNYRLTEIVRKIPPDAKIVIETDMDSHNDLSSFERDVSYLRNCVE